MTRPREQARRRFLRELDRRLQQRELVVIEAEKLIEPSSGLDK
jgi:hypothetical protein